MNTLMRHPHPAAWPALLAITLMYVLGARAQQLAPPAADEGYDVLPRGPVHEAFADPAAPGKPAPVVLKQPPAPIEEEPPAQKPDGNNVQWIGGYWAWDDEKQDYLWVSGFWRDLPPGRQWVPGYWGRLADGWQRVAGYWAEDGQGRFQYLPEPPESLDIGPSAPAPGDEYFYAPGLWVYRDNRYLWRPGFWLRYYLNWIWCPPRYVWTPSGHLYVSGYWDYPLQSRGLLFAPAWFRRPLWTTAGWAYRPRYVVSSPNLLGALFVGPRGGYFFGDYFGPSYRSAGYTPWLNARIGGQALDPLSTYYRWQNRGDPRWEPNLTALYANRGARNGNLLTPLTQVDPGTVRLRTISEARRLEERDAQRQLRTFSQERQQVETQPPPRSGARVVYQNLPKSPAPVVSQPIRPETIHSGTGRPSTSGDGRPTAAVARPPEHIPAQRSMPIPEHRVAPPPVHHAAPAAPVHHAAPAPPASAHRPAPSSSGGGKGKDKH